jgi:hypothetical protein
LPALLPLENEEGNRFATRRAKVKAIYAARRVRRSLLRGPSSDYFDEIRQFFAGIEIYPFACRVQIGQAPIFFALNPDQVLLIWIQSAGLAIFCV